MSDDMKAEPASTPEQIRLSTVKYPGPNPMDRLRQDLYCGATLRRQRDAAVALLRRYVESGNGCCFCTGFCYEGGHEPPCPLTALLKEIDG